MTLGGIFFSHLGITKQESDGNHFFFPVNPDVSLQQHMLPHESNPQLRILNSQDTKASLYQTDVSLDKSSSVACEKGVVVGE